MRTHVLLAQPVSTPRENTHVCAHLAMMGNSAKTVSINVSANHRITRYLFIYTVLIATFKNNILGTL